MCRAKTVEGLLGHKHLELCLGMAEAGGLMCSGTATPDRKGQDWGIALKTKHCMLGLTAPVGSSSLFRTTVHPCYPWGDPRTLPGSRLLPAGAEMQPISRVGSTNSCSSVSYLAPCPCGLDLPAQL